MLGVSETAIRRRSRSAYRKLARAEPPRHQPWRRCAEERFKEISAAYDVVGDADKRKEYDEVRKLGPVGRASAARAAGSAAPAASRSRPTTWRRRRRPRRHPRQPVRPRRRRGAASRGTGPQRGADLEAVLHLDFADAVPRHHHGHPPHQRCHVLHLPRHGARPGTAPKVCPHCGGRGVLDDNQGFFSFCQPCPQLRRPWVHRSTTRARRAMARVSSGGPARSRCASPPASPTASASG